MKKHTQKTLIKLEDFRAEERAREAAKKKCRQLRIARNGVAIRLAEARQKALHAKIEADRAELLVQDVLAQFHAIDIRLETVRGTYL